MNNITQDDIDMLYWHAVTKLRQGNFYSAHQFFRYVMQIAPTFYVGLAMAYAALRNGDLAQARHDLAQISPTNAKEERFYRRLERRLK